MIIRKAFLVLMLAVVGAPTPLRSQGDGPVPVVPPVEVTVNGRPLRPNFRPADTDTIVISNGFVSISRLATRFDQRAGVVATAGPLLAVRGELLSAEYGDYTFVGASVVTEPTKVEILKADADEAIVRWSFAQHRLNPSGTHGDSSLADGKYPFTKTVWVRRGVSGYWTLMEPLLKLPNATASGRYEHEVGFGGLWGSGELRLGSARLRSDTIQRTFRATRAEQTGYAEWVREGEYLRRILVPMPLRGFLVPVFDNVNRGGTWILVYRPKRFGAFLGFSPPVASYNPTVLCTRVLLEAPAEFRVPESEREIRQRCNTTYGDW
jgi:hypothetical protein